MEMDRLRVTLDELRRIDIIEFLRQNGIEPEKIRGNQFWYRSPLRSEAEASFKVNRSLNSWFDFGLMKGGNFIDFAILYFDCTVGELLRIMRGEMKAPLPLFDPLALPPARDEKIEVGDVRPLTSPALLRYLQTRRIDLKVADRFCSQVHFSIGEKNYYAIGFANDAGGFELRNEFLKLSSSPKAPTSIDFGAREVVVVEGFFNLLAFLSMHVSEPIERFNYSILNSVAMFEVARPFIDAHDSRLLYLDNDTSGRNCVIHARSLSDAYEDRSQLYRNHNDLNDFLCHFGLPAQRHRKNHHL